MVQPKSLIDMQSLSHLDKTMTAKPNKYPQQGFKNKLCKWCNTEFEPQAPSQFYYLVSCKKEARLDSRFRKLYGISGEEAVDMYNAQGGLCKICNTEGFLMHKNKKHGLNLDHCHATGVARGWLCDNCNRALGLLQDSVTNLENAIEYLNTSRDESPT